MEIVGTGCWIYSWFTQPLQGTFFLRRLPIHITAPARHILSAQTANTYYSPCKAHSFCADCQYILSYGTRTVDVLQAMFLHRTQYQDYGISLSGGTSHWRSRWIIFSQVTTNISVFTHKGETKLVDNFLCGLLHKTKTVEEPLLFLWGQL
jgi:hypothetical protein